MITTSEKIGNYLTDDESHRNSAYVHEAIHEWDKLVGLCPRFDEFVNNYVTLKWHDLVVKN